MYVFTSTAIMWTKMHIDGSKSSGQTLSQFAPLDLSRWSWLKIDFRGRPCCWWFTWNIHTKIFFALDFDMQSLWQGIESAEENLAMLFISYNMSNLKIIWTTKRMGTFSEVVQNRWPMLWMEKHLCLCVQLCLVSSILQALLTSCQSLFICQT